MTSIRSLTDPYHGKRRDHRRQKAGSHEQNNDILAREDFRAQMVLYIELQHGEVYVTPRGMVHSEAHPFHFYRGAENDYYARRQQQA